MKYLFSQFVKGVGVGALVAMQELNDFCDTLGIQLFVDGVQVAGLVLPEFELRHGAWIIALFQGLFWFELENVLDLFGPGDDGALQQRYAARGFG